MRPLKSLISIDKAKEIINENLIIVNDIEEVELMDLVGRVASMDVTSDKNVPPFRRAAMDGYAIKASSIFSTSESSPVVLDCIEKIHAGEIPSKAVSESECIEIATGAMIPESADTVVPVEYTNVNGDRIEFLKSFAPKANVSSAGVDIKNGEIVVHKDEMFTPARVGVLAALNIRKANVYRKPKVAIIPTGREIATLGSQLQDGQVYDINSYTLSTLIKQHGGIPKVYDVVPDEMNALEKVVIDAFSADLVVIAGGSSVGERDINIDVIRKHGDVLFHGIQIKPGKPTLFGRLKNNDEEKMVFNLPGYPTSCLTNGYIMLLPVLRKMAHLPEMIVKKVKAKASKKIITKLGRHQILTVKVKNGEVIPAFKESGAITSMAWADGYIEIPYNVDLIDKGEEVEVTLF